MSEFMFKINPGKYHVILLSLILLAGCSDGEVTGADSTVKASASVSKTAKQVLIDAHIQDKPLPGKLDFQNILPEVVYGTPGLPIELYFQNMSPAIDHNEFYIVVQCSCKFGRAERRKWIGVPAEKDIGTHQLSIIMTDKTDNKVYHLHTSIVVSSETTNLEKVRLLIVGDSITRQQQYPNRLVRYASERLNLQVSTFGNVHLQFDPYDPSFFEPADPGVYTEAYNGWSTAMFLNKYWVDSSSINNDSDVSRPPFWYGPSLNDGKLNFERYVEQVGKGEYPDVIIVMLGTNDVFSANPYVSPELANSIDKSSQAITENLEEMIETFRAGGRKIPVIVVTPPPTSLSETAAKILYGDTIAKKYNTAVLILSKRILEKFNSREDEKIYAVSNYLGFDSLDGYMQTQVVHPSNTGHVQIANQVYSRLVSILSQKEESDFLVKNRQVNAKLIHK